MTRRKIVAGSLASLMLAGLTLACGSRPEPLEVTYYYLPGWPVCARAQLAVSELEEEFPGRVEARSLDATTPEAARAVAELGFRSHGLVVRSPAGEVLATQPDHTFDRDALRSTLSGLIGG